MIEDKPLAKHANRSWRVTTKPTIEPISVDEVKLFARIDGTDEDDLIASFIESARLACENYLCRTLIEQTITLKMDYWADTQIELPRPPLISITEVETLDESNVATVYSSDNYYSIIEDDLSLLCIKKGYSIPENTARDFGGFQVRYKAGYGSTASSVPAPIREALKFWVTHMYESRTVLDTPPFEAMAILDRYRVMRLD